MKAEWLGVETATSQLRLSGLPFNILHWESNTTTISPSCSS